nr:DUF4143 domain-containing protein [uncultured Acidaminococcus sp.]
MLPRRKQQKSGPAISLFLCSWRREIRNFNIKLYSGLGPLLFSELPSVRDRQFVYGTMTENYVAQQVAASGLPLYYWESKSTAELDFVFPVEANIYGVEAKKEEHIRSRSLGVFREQEKPTGAIRFFLKNFGFKNGMWSVPLYVAFCLPAGL